MNTLKYMIVVILSCDAAACAAGDHATPTTKQSTLGKAPARVNTGADPTHWALAPTPPMGWNSYDAFRVAVTEDEVLG